MAGDARLAGMNDAAAMLTIGWPPFPPHGPAFEWTIAALRAHP